MAITTEFRGTILHITIGSAHLATDLEKWHRNNRVVAMLMGAKSRIVDKLGAADLSDQDRVAIAQAMIAHYESGSPDWRIGASGGTGGDAVRAVMRAFDLDLTAARAKIEENAKKLGISEATMRQRLITLPGKVRDAYAEILRERGVEARGEELLGDFN